MTIAELVGIYSFSIGGKKLNSSGVKSFPWLISSAKKIQKNKIYQLSFHNQDYIFWKNSYDQYIIISNICPHQRAALANGKLCYIGKNSYVECPYHGYIYSDKHLNINGRIQSLSPIEEVYLVEKQGYLWLIFSTEIQIPDIHSFLDEGGYKLTNSFKGIESINYIDFLSNVVDSAHFQQVHSNSFFIGDHGVEEINSLENNLSFDMILYKRKPRSSDYLNVLYWLTPKKITQKVSFILPNIVKIEFNFDSMFAKYGLGKLKGQGVIAIVNVFPANENKIAFQASFFGKFYLPWMLKKILNYFMGRLQQKLFKEDISILRSIYSDAKIPPLVLTDADGVLDFLREMIKKNLY